MDDVDAAVCSLLRRPAVRMVASGQAVPPERYTTSVRIGGDTVTGAADPAKVWAALDSGATLSLQALHRSAPRVAAFCRELELALTHPVQANAYITPPSARGLGVHHDTHDVFVLQLAGTKRWEVYEPVISRPVPSQKWNADEPQSPLHLQVTLRPGDVLYVPRGYPHVARSDETLSAHLTIGVLVFTGLDLLRALLRVAEDDEELRRSLPPGFAAASGGGTPAWERELLQRFVELAGTCAAEPSGVLEAVARRFWSSLHAVVPGQLAQLEATRRLHDATPLRRRSTAVWWPRVEGGELVGVMGDRTLRMPAALEKVVAVLLDGDTHQLAELDALIDEPSRLVLARRLVREGLLEALA